MTQYVYAGAAPWSGASPTDQPGGLFRQAIGSGEWQLLTNGLPVKSEIRAIAIHPQNSQVVYIGTQAGPYRSNDGGDHWEQLNLPDPGMVVWSILFHPQNPQTLYVGTAPPAIYRSDDSGSSWRKLSLVDPVGMVKMGFPCRVIRMSADPNNPHELYAGLEVGGVIRSLDGGETWDDCTRPLLKFTEQDHLKSQLISDTQAEGMMDSHALSVSAAKPGTVFLATRMGLFSSADRGTTWQEMEIWKHSPLSYARDVQVAPHNPNMLYAALSPAAMSNAGSLYRSPDLGQSWQRFDHSVPVKSTMMTVALSPSNEKIVYCATRKGQVIGTQDGGATWAEYPLPAAKQDVYALACG